MHRQWHMAGQLQGIVIAALGLVSVAAFGCIRNPPSPVSQCRSDAQPLQELSVVSLTDTALVTLYTTNPGEVIGAPTWSPDRSQIAFSRNTSADSGLYEVGVADRRVSLITPEPIEAPSWSLESSAILGVVDEPALSRIVTYDVGTANLATKKATSNAKLATPSTSRDGKTLTYVKDEPGRSSIVASVGSDTEFEVVNTPSPASVHDPQFTTDGHSIAYWLSDRGQSSMWIVDVNRPHFPHQLSTDVMYPEQPRPSPRGDAIAFTGRQEDVRRLFIQDPTTGSISSPTHGPLSVSDPAWASDASRIAVISEMPACE